MRFQIEKRGGRRMQAGPELRRVGDKVIGSTAWLDEGGTRVERYQVLTIRNGKIVDMQGCASRREAERYARRTAT